MNRYSSHATPSTRRAFLKSMAWCGAALAASPHAFAQAPAPRPPDTVATGHIGAGRLGQDLIRACSRGAVAVCDLNEDRLRSGAALAAPGVRGYSDYRELLDNDAVEAVVIATPDHWHAVQAIHAMEAGKDVYIALPVCHAPGEGGELIRAAETFGAVVGVGHEAPPWAAIETAAPPARLRLWAPPHPEAVKDTGEAPPYWDRWLGPARPIEYTEGLDDGGHAFHPDFGSGHLGRIGSQFLYHLMANGLLPDAGPIVATSEPFPFSLGGTLPRSYSVTWTTGGTEIQWEQPDTVGEQTGLAGDGTNLWTNPLDRAQMPGSLEDWLDRVRRRDTNIEPLRRAVRAAAYVQTARLSGRLGRPLTWDPARNGFQNAPDADRLLMQDRYGIHLYGLEHDDA